MTPQSPTSETAASSAPMPIFYQRPEMLLNERHAGKSLSSKIDYRFSQATNSVPLNGVELGVAQRHYPIVFSDEAAPFPLAILGLRNAENLFLGGAGLWEDKAYVPAYIRRYPFIFLTGPDQKQFALGIDAASSFVIDGDSNPFFRDGQPTELTKNALAFCASFQAEYEKTRAFAAALAEQKLLETKTADIELGGGQKLRFGPFRAVEEARLGALPDAVAADWLRRGWLAWIHAHLLSFANWQAIAGRLKAPA